jgi:hypothetical protein
VRFYFLDTFPAVWNDLEISCKKAACLSPPLVSSRGGAGTNLFHFELSKVVVVDGTNITKCGGDNVIRKLCQSLIQQDLTTVPLNYAIFLAMVAFVETLRLSENLDATNLMWYITDCALASDSIVCTLLPKLIDQLFLAWFDTAKLKLADGQFSSSCRSIIMQVFVSYTFTLMGENTLVQSLSENFLRKMIDSFPWLSWQYSVAFNTLDSLHAVAILKYPELKDSEDSFYKDLFPTDIVCSSMVLKRVFDVVYQLISVGLYYASGNIRTVAVDYALLQRVAVCKNHVALAVIRELLISFHPTYHLSPSQRTYSVLIVERSKSAENVSSYLQKHGFSHAKGIDLDLFDDEISLKVRVVGEASNILTTLTHNARPFLIKDFESHLRINVSGCQVSAVDAINYMKLNTALVREVMLAADLGEEVKRSMLIDLAFNLFFASESFINKEVLMAAFDNCRWMSLCSPCTDVFNQIYSLNLENLVQNKAGMFSSSISPVEAPEDVDLLVVKNFLNSPVAFCPDTMCQMSFFDHFDCDILLSNTSSFDFMASCICSAFYGLQKLRDHKVDRKSIWPRFKLCSLALKLLSFSITSASCSMSIDWRCKLRECIYSSVLLWFETPVTWAEPSASGCFTPKLIESIYEFLELLEKDKHFWLLDYDLSFEGSTVWQSLFEPVFWSLRGHKTVADMNNTSGLEFITDIFIAIRLLTFAELDRIIAWHGVTLMHSKANNVKTTLKEMHSTCAHGSIYYDCWLFSPILSMRIPERVPGLIQNLSILSKLIGRVSSPPFSSLTYVSILYNAILRFASV